MAGHDTLQWRPTQFTVRRLAGSLTIMKYPVFCLVIATVLAIAAASLWLPSDLLPFIVLGLICLIGVVALRDTGWANVALSLTAIFFSLALLELGAEVILPERHGKGLVTTFDPPSWLTPDPDLGFRPLPGSRVRAVASYDGETVYDVIYSIEGSGARSTPPADPNADTYLFVGDSFMFGQGLRDDETMPAQFARGFPANAKAALFAAPGYGPNQFVRMLETGRLDAFGNANTKAVITWIIPPYLSRVAGEEPWLGSAPRYSIDNGLPVFTGAFDAWRQTHPIEGAYHWLGQRLSIASAIGQKQREDRQAELFESLMLYMQKLVQDRIHVPLVVLYSWPDRESPPNFNGLGAAQSRLVSIIEHLREHGLPLVEVNRVMYGIPNEKLMIPHDGHPTAFANQLVATRLREHITHRAPSPDR